MLGSLLEMLSHNPEDCPFDMDQCIVIPPMTEMTAGKAVLICPLGQDLLWPGNWE